MGSFRWDKCFFTGLTEVDAQHHQLIDLINDFGDLLTRSGGTEIDNDNLEAVFQKLAAYARYHFAEEESLMSRAGLDPRHIQQHCRAHATFLAEVTQMHSGISSGNPGAATFLLKFLTHWLAYHILGMDQFMAKQIAAVQAGQKAADAYVTEKIVKDGATGTLLNALNGLFQQVSERNRELFQLNQTLETKVADRTRELLEANQQLETMAMTDVLTGLPNRRYALQSFVREWAASVRYSTPLSCMLIDADGFKQINDAYGHAAGDEVLRQLSSQLKRLARADDIVCRLGGDEFLIICGHTSLDGAMKMAEKIRRGIALLRIPAGGGEWRGSISVGLAERTDDMDTPEDLMKAADSGVYRAKLNGRNCVESVPWIKGGPEAPGSPTIAASQL